MGDFLGGKEHFDRALAIYDPAEYRPLTTRSGGDVGVALLSVRSRVSGYSVILRLRAMMPSAQSTRRARSATPPH